MLPDPALSDPSDANPGGPLPELRLARLVAALTNNCPPAWRTMGDVAVPALGVSGMTPPSQLTHTTEHREPRLLQIHVQPSVATSATVAPSTAAPAPLEAPRRTLFIHVALILVLLPTAFVIALTCKRSHLLLFLGHFLVAGSAWKLSWLGLRLRTRLLLHLLMGVELEEAPVTDADVDAVEDAVSQRVQAHKWMIEPLADKWFCGHRVLLTWGVAAVAGGLGLVAAMAYEWADPPDLGKRSRLGWHMIMASSANAAFVTALAACASASYADAFVILVYQVCFVASSLNTFLAHQEKWIKEPELLDQLYLLLVGSCLNVMCRVVSSKNVLDTLFMVIVDAFGFMALVSPLMTIADIVDHPKAMVFKNDICIFVIVLLAAEMGNLMLVMLRHQWQVRWWRKCNELPPRMPHQLVAACALAAVLALCGLVVAKGCFHQQLWNWGQVVVIVAAVVLAQCCRGVFAEMVEFADGKQASSFSSCGSFVVSVSSFLIGTIVYHPYIKVLYNDHT